MNNSVNLLAEVLKEKMPGRVYCSEPMSRHTSFKIGGPADVLVQPENSEGLAFALAAAKDYEVPVTILGNGSNVLVRDKGIRGLVIQLGNALKVSAVTVTGCSSVPVIRWLWRHAKRGNVV